MAESERTVEDIDKERQEEVKRREGMKGEKHPYIFCFLLWVTKLYLTTSTVATIVWPLQRYLILTTPAKWFHEIRFHYMVNCTTEADT